MMKCSSLDTRVQPSILNAVWEELNAGFRLWSKLPEADGRSSECPLCILHTQAGGEEDPRQFSSPKQSLFYWCPGWVAGEEDRRRSGLGDGARVWGPECPKLAVWMQARPPGTCFPSPYGKDFTNAQRVIRPTLKSRTLILCEKSVQERNTRVSMWLYHAV